MKKNEAMNPPVEETAVATATTYTDVAFAKEAQKRNKIIKTELQKIEVSFEKIAFSVHWFYRTKGYEQLGYKTISDFTAVEYGMKKSRTYDYINIVERFAKRDENGEVIDCIREEFVDFQSSKLTALLEVPMDEQLAEFDATMSVRDIKKKIKEMDSDEDDAKNSDSGNGDSDNSGNDVIDTTAQEVYRQEVISFDTLASYNEYLDGMIDLIEKNLKSKVFKDGKHKIEVSIVWTE